jgi:hypothetical protein
METDLRQLAQKQIYNGITLIILHVNNNLLAQRWPTMLSERAVYKELKLWTSASFVTGTLIYAKRAVSDTERGNTVPGTAVVFML